ncbi:MAG: hypothetical protein V3W04_13795 [Gammaproteobacteria bacterium]
MNTGKRCARLLMPVVWIAAVSLVSGCHWSDFVTIKSGTGKTWPRKTTTTKTTPNQTTTKTAQKRRVIDFEMEYPVDVDTAYKRLKVEFGMRNLEEILRAEAGSTFQTGMLKDGKIGRFRHVTLPGTSYFIRDLGWPEREAIVTFKLERKGKKNTAIKAFANTTNVAKPAEFESNFKTRVIKALKGD